jgi:hypothetical protein
MNSQLKANLTQLAIPSSDVGAMSVDYFCRWACIGRTKVYAEIKAGRLVMRKIGAKSVILRADAEEWLRSLPAAPS